MPGNNKAGLSGISRDKRRTRKLSQSSDLSLEMSVERTDDVSPNGELVVTGSKDTVKHVGSYSRYAAITCTGVSSTPEDKRANPGVYNCIRRGVVYVMHV